MPNSHNLNHNDPQKGCKQYHNEIGINFLREAFKEYSDCVRYLSHHTNGPRNVYDSGSRVFAHNINLLKKVLMRFRDLLEEIQRQLHFKAFSSILKAKLLFCRELLSPSFVMRTFASDGSEIIEGLKEVGNLYEIYGCVKAWLFYLTRKNPAT